MAFRYYALEKYGANARKKKELDHGGSGHGGELEVSTQRKNLLTRTVLLPFGGPGKPQDVL